MVPPGSQHPHTVSGRLIELLRGRGRRISVLIALTYCSAVAGLAVTFLGGIDRPESDVSAVGIALLFASFVGMFYLSVTLLSVGEGSHGR